MYGKSTSNQRIEAWWGILRRQGGEYWISLFKDLRDSGLLHLHNNIHKQALRFSFMHLIRNDLNNIAIEWNQHTIDSKSSAEAPKGKPDILYYLPERLGTQEFWCKCGPGRSGTNGIQHR